MSAVAGVFKGLGAAAIAIGCVLVVFGLVTAVTGYGEYSEETDKESDGNPFTRGDGEKAEQGAHMAFAGLAGAGMGALLLGLGLIFYFTANGAQQRAEHNAKLAQLTAKTNE